MYHGQPSNTVTYPLTQTKNIKSRDRISVFNWTDLQAVSHCSQEQKTSIYSASNQCQEDVHTSTERINSIITIV